MFVAEEFMYGPGPTPAVPRRAARWLRRAGSWLVVVLAHGVVVALVLSISPQARQVLDQVIQANLILPQPLPVAPPEPPKPQEPRPRPKKMLPPPRPTPVLAAAPRAEAAPAPFVVPPAPVEPAPAAPVEPAPVEPAPVVAASVAPPAPLVPPVFNANYLENPAPRYPPASRRMGEQGQVMLRVYVSSKGRAERVDIKTSSGFDRLDRAAMDAVQGWRFVPARRGEELVAAWVLVPVSFVMKVS